MKNSILKFFIFSFFLLSNVMMFAQGTDNDTGNLEGDDPPATPINTKLVWLALMGIFFAIYTFRKNKKRI